MRRLASGGTDVHRERAQVADDVDRRAVFADVHADAARFDEARTRAAAGPHVTVGTTAAGPYLLGANDLPLGHALITGMSGSGKTTFTMALLDQVLRRPPAERPAIVSFDMKGDATEGVLAIAARMATQDPNFARTHLQVLRVFSGRYLVPLQLLASQPGVPPPAQAQAIAETIEATVGVGTGIRQTGALAALLLLASTEGWSIPELRYHVLNVPLLKDAAMRSPYPHVRTYFSTRFEHEATATTHGIIARIDALCAFDELRAMTSAPNCIDFTSACEPGMVTAIDGSGASLGNSNVGQAMGATLFERVCWAGFDPRRTRRADVLLVADELQTAFTPRVLAAIERIVTLGRSFRFHLWSVHQSVEQLPRELIAMLNTNVTRRIAGRCSARDADLTAEWLPVTGRMLRPRERWEGPARVPEFLSSAEERRAGIEHLQQLQRQEFLVADRRAPHAARFVRAPDYRAPSLAQFPPAVRDAVERGAWGIDRHELLERAAAIEEEAAQTLVAAQTEAPAKTRSHGRDRRGPDAPDATAFWNRGRRGGWEVP